MLDIPVGLENRLTITSSAKDSAESFGNAGVDVVATPALIGFLEQAAGRALKAYMSPDEVTLGTMIDVQHLGAAPVGAAIDCTARVTAIEIFIFSSSFCCSEAMTTHSLCCCARASRGAGSATGESA